MAGRTSTLAGELARRGLQNSELAAAAVDAIVAAVPAASGIDWIDEVGAAADPDLALQGLGRLVEHDPGLASELFADQGWLARTVAVLGASVALNQHIRAHPDDLRVLRAAPQRATTAELQAAMPDATLPDAGDLLRLANKRELLRIAGRDLTHPDPVQIVDQISAELADLADAILGCALAIAGQQVPGCEQIRLAVIALGKCGARELNYLSDIDVLYVAEPASDQIDTEQALQIASDLVAAASRICSAHTPAGTIWQVDAGLRPDGKAGPLVRSLEAMRAYYAKWAKNWEFQAMLKARPMAGDVELGQRFCDLVAPLVWQAGGQENFMSETQAMRKRVVALIPARTRDREIKLGPGGLRDVEFSVQLLQLVHGRADERLRLRGTWEALDALVAHGYISRADGARLDEAYRFMRVLEHREQLFRLRRTHLMPDQPTERRRLARQLGVENGDELWQRWRQVTRDVLRLQQRVFYSPLLATVSRLSSDELRLSPDAAADRLRALGFSDPGAALRHIESLTTGLSRSSEIQRQLMPALLHWFSEGPNPDLGLLGFRRLSDQMGTTSWYLRALRDEGAMAERLARLLSASRYISDLLRRDAAMVQLLADSGQVSQPRDRADLAESLLKVAERHADDPVQAAAAIRGFRARELFRLAAGDVLGTLSLADLGAGLADLTGATIDAMLQVAWAQVGGPRLPIGVVALGRWGGREMGFASDADAFFVVGDETDAEDLGRAEQVITRTRALLGQPGPEPPLQIDPDLRPDGKNGPMLRTLSGYLGYYAKWSDTWEAQALVRAGFGAGDPQLVAGLLDGIAPRRYPEGGISAAQVIEIRRLKARMENERAGRASIGQNLKLGRGGLSDVEWTVQLLQLQHAHHVPGLRTPSTLAALDAARDAGLVDGADVRVLTEAWTLGSQLRNKTMLVRGKASDLLPSDPRETASVALLLGYGPGQASELMQAWAKAARHAAQVVDRLFWGTR